MTPYAKGKKAYLLGKDIHDNPYVTGILQSALEWQEGWLAEERQTEKDEYRCPCCRSKYNHVC